MAYFNDPLDEENEQQDPNAPAPIGPQGSATIQGGGSGAGGGAQPPQAASGAPDKGSNFVGISSYLNANKPQAQKLGDQASGVISNSANDARTSVNDLNSAFNQKAGSAQTIDQGVLGKVGQAETLGEPEKQQIKSAYNAQYQGPNALTDLGDQYNTAGQKLSTAKKNVEAAGSEGGRQNLITQINAKPRTQGVTNFDSVLLQAGGGREKLDQAAQANKDVAGDVLGQSNLAAQQKAADIKEQTDATRTATQSAVGGAQTSLGDSISQRLKEMQGGLTARNNEITQDLGDNAYALDEKTLADFGLSEGQRSYGFNPMDYWKQGDISQLNNETVAKQEEFARAAALAELSGGQSFLNQGDIAKAGTADQYTSKFDKDKLLADLGAKEKDYLKKGNYNIRDVLKNTAAPGSGGATAGDVVLEMGHDTDSYGRVLASQLGMAAPKSNLNNATPEQIQKEWMPIFKKLSAADKGNAIGNAFQQYFSNIVDPFKVSDKNTFSKNKGT